MEDGLTCVSNSGVSNYDSPPICLVSATFIRVIDLIGCRSVLPFLFELHCICIALASGIVSCIDSIVASQWSVCMLCTIPYVLHAQPLFRMWLTWLVSPFSGTVCPQERIRSAIECYRMFWIQLMLGSYITLHVYDWQDKSTQFDNKCTGLQLMRGPHLLLLPPTLCLHYSNSCLQTDASIW